MPGPSIARCLRPAVFAVLAAWALPAHAASEEKILTASEIAALGRENAMWRLVRPDEEVPANLARLVKAGFTADEVAGVQLRLAAWWDVPVERNFGWLHEETIEQVKEIDRRFVVRVRAARLFEGTGILKELEKPATVGTLTGQWRAAVLKALNFDELAEFRLMNSASARQLAQLVKDLPVSDDELRTLFQWQREYEGTHGPAGPASASQPAWQRQDQLDQWRRIRGLLGDARFAVYLGRASPAFAKMRAALDHAGAAASPPVLIDLWWLRQQFELAQQREPTFKGKENLRKETRAKVSMVVGAEPLAAYLQNADGRWLADRPVVVRSAPKPAASSP